MQSTGIGIDAPEVVAAGQEFTVTVLGASMSAEVDIRVVEADSDRTMLLAPALVRESADRRMALTFSVRLEAGLFRIEVAYGNRHTVERLLLVVNAAE